MKNIITSLTFSSIIAFSCNAQQPDANELQANFPKGQPGPADLFTGNAYNIGLVPNDSIYTTLIGNIYFEPGARSNWHSHPSGQILIITDGIGFHQIEGQPKQTSKKGDVVKYPSKVKHWHGASVDTGLQQIYAAPNTENGILDWMGPVSNENILLISMVITHLNF